MAFNKKKIIIMLIAQIEPNVIKSMKTIRGW